MTLPAYPAYKDSGVEWLGEIPAAWSAERLNDIAILKTSNVDKKTVEGQDEVKLCNYVDVYYNDKITSELDFMKASATPSEFKKFSLSKGDVVFTKDSESPFDIGIPAVVAEDIDNLVCGYHLSIVQGMENKLIGVFLFYALVSEPSVCQFTLAANGVTRFGLTQQGTKNIRIPVPSLDEQQAIADYLDQKTGQIDSLIEKKKELIERLKEQRTAIITHAVTKGLPSEAAAKAGLDPNPPMKDSGIEWLGKVPEHWDAVKLSFRYEVQLGKMLDDKKITKDFLGHYIRNTDVQWDRINTDDLPQMDFRPHEVERYSVKKGDLIVCEGGEVGRCAIWSNDEPCFYQKALHRLRPHDHTQDLPRFMFYLLCDSVSRERFANATGKATIAHLPAETFRTYRFAFPPIEEQRVLIKYLDDKAGQIDRLIKKVHQAIQRLEEYRTAVISAAVTGKVKVV
jgi:type I restriction enzyme S subunit